ncbi:ABC-F family ATP-binding cassette domain-containing protein [archaeon]|nr:MAG: ABC-F family ATP-binding cassette domain-containing protein [archaeon]
MCTLIFFPRARQAKSKHREGEVMRLRDEVEGGRKRSMLLRGSEMQLGGMGEVGRLGGKVLEMREAGYRVEGPDIRKGEEGKVLFQDFIFSLCPGERVAVIGGNGSGKTSLLSLLSGLKKLTWGTLDKGESVSVGYFSQSLPPLPVEAEGMTAFAYLLSEINKRAIKDGEGRKSGGPMLKVTEVDIASRRKRKEGKTSVVTASVVDYVGKESVGPSENEVRKWLKDFNLPPSVWYTPLLKLSGGERRRLELLRVLASRPNVLLLDEPTNDLDIYALYALENYLANEFTTSDGDEKAGGAVVFVSHDSYFVQNVAQRVLVMPGKGKKEKSILEVQGGYEEYKKRTDTGQKIE